jgi:hypothetical protein
MPDETTKPKISPSAGLLPAKAMMRQVVSTSRAMKATKIR